MPRLLRTVARTAAIAGTASAVSGRVQRRQANKWSQQEAAQAPPEAAPAPAAAAPAPAAPSMIDQLKELGELKDQGILTEDEFAAQKARLLAG
jgi:superfamily I DNA/RNA helicase